MENLTIRSISSKRERERERHIDTDRQKDKDTERQREREKYAQNKSDRKVCNRTEVSSAIIFGPLDLVYRPSSFKSRYIWNKTVAKR